MNSLTHLLADATLSDAIISLENDIKAAPADADKRAALTQLLCLSGNWQRARAQLKSWQALKPIAQPTVLLLTQSVEAEIQRQAVFAGEAAPSFKGYEQSWLPLMAEALRLDANGDAAAAQEMRDRALEEAPATRGSLTLAEGGEERDVSFDWLMDGDGRLGPLCEALLNGTYHWVPFSDIEEIRFQAPQSAIDLVWSHALIRLNDGREQVCQLPARYPLPDDADDALRLARRTEWVPMGDTPHYAGLGQKTWLSEDGEFPLHTLRHLRFGQDGDEEQDGGK